MTNRSKPQSGFTLLEVLIALVVISIGVLGLAGLQALGLRYNHDAFIRTQATLLANDLMDRMRVRTFNIQDGPTLEAQLQAYQNIAPAAAAAGDCNPAVTTPAGDLECWMDAVFNAGLPGVVPGAAAPFIPTLAQNAGTGTAGDPTDDTYILTFTWGAREAQAVDQNVEQRWEFQP